MMPANMPSRLALRTIPAEPLPMSLDELTDTHRPRHVAFIFQCCCFVSMLLGCQFAQVNVGEHL